MRRNLIFIVSLTLIGLLGLSLPTFAQEPVKWSAPMNAYPNPWTPTTAPPTQSNPYGYQYPYAAYGYGNAAAQYYPGAYQPQYSGNPYYYYYGQ